MSKDSPDTTVGLDKKFSEKVEKQNQKRLDAVLILTSARGQMESEDR